ncbi:MAG TPA: type II toxin-antitoxin system RelE/ParE family toxin [Candidatus Binataceae bacterium]|nr:type II toxin-antitoxin system RelE/ParE family toxin [Candidatus Binataceae bacterium]
MRWRIEEHLTAAGQSLIRDFIGGLSSDGRAEAAALIKVLEEWGNTLGMPHSKPLGHGLFELRGRQVRIFYTFLADRRIVLLDGVLKKRSRVPTAVIQRMRKLQSEVS